VDEEEIKIKMDDGVDTPLASWGIDLFVDLLARRIALYKSDQLVGGAAELCLCVKVEVAVLGSRP